jgi:hypothetical protein
VSEVEQLMAQLWGELLGVERVGIHDNFFELGGDSILSLRILARANQAGLQLSTRFFEEDFRDPHHWNQSVLLEA